MRYLVFAVVAFAASAFPAVAQEKLTACYVGQRVETPGGAQGTVVALRGTGGCDVRGDRFKDVQTWAAFMLKPVAGSPVKKAEPVAATPKAGLYQCNGGAAGIMKLRFAGAGSYSNEQGSSGAYKMRPSGQMEFTSGPWKGFYAKTLPNGRVGLTSVADGTFYNMTCDPR